MPPQLTAIIGFIDAAIAADNQVVGISGIDPERVIIDVPVSVANIGKCCAAVTRPLRIGIKRIERVFVKWIDDQLIIILRAGRHVTGALLPVLAEID